MKIYKLAIILLILLMPSMSAQDLYITQFDDGSSIGTFDFVFKDLESFTKYITLPAGVLIKSAVLNITESTDFVEGNFSYTFDTETEYYKLGNESSTAWSSSAGVTNPSYAYDGNVSTATLISVNQKYLYLNFTRGTTNNTIYDANVTVYMNDNTGADTAVLTCEDDDTEGTYIIISTIHGNHISGSVYEINEDCYNSNNDLINIRLETRTVGDTDAIYEVAVNYSGFPSGDVSYPFNLSLTFNNSIYPTYNSSLIDLNKYGALQTQANKNRTVKFVFHSTTTATLNYTGLNITYSANHTMEFHHELNESLANDVNVSLTRTYANNYDNDRTETGVLNVANVGINGITKLFYYADYSEFVSRSYYYYNDQNTTYNHTLYLINGLNVTEVLFTLYQENGNTVPNYYVAVEKYRPSTDDFMVVEMHKMDFNGQAIMYLSVLDEYYRFLIYNTNLELVYTSEETLIKSASLSLTVQLTEDIWRSLTYINDISLGNPVYNNETSQISIYYNDTNDVVDYIQFKVTHRTLFGDTVICDNISEESENSLYCSINSSAAGMFVSEVWMESNTNHSLFYLAGSVWQNSSTADTAGYAGLIAVVFLLIGVAVLGMFNPALAIILGLMSLVLAVMTNLIFIPVGVLAVLIILGGLGVFLMKT